MAKYMVFFGGSHRTDVEHCMVRIPTSGVSFACFHVSDSRRMRNKPPNASMQLVICAHHGIRVLSLSFLQCSLCGDTFANRFLQRNLAISFLLSCMSSSQCENQVECRATFEIVIACGFVVGPKNITHGVSTRCWGCVPSRLGCSSHLLPTVDESLLNGRNSLLLLHTFLYP